MLAPLAGSVALAVLLGVAAFVVVNRDRGCSGDALPLRVTAAPDIQPVLSRIAARFNEAAHEVDGRCAVVTVTKALPAIVTSSLAGVGGKTSPMHVWIPDSSLWLSSLRADRADVPTEGTSVARSPIVLAASGSVVPNLKKSLGEIRWRGVVGAANVANVDGPGRKVRVLMLDPSLNATGLGALLSASAAVGPGGAGQEQLVGALKSLSGSSATLRDQEALLSSLGVKGAKAPVGVASEQSVWAFNTTRKPEVPVVPLYPAEGTLSLDYPMVVVTEQAAERAAAEAFRKELEGEASREALRSAGFRTPDGRGGKAISDSGGFRAQAPQALKTPDARTVAGMIQTWSRIKLGSRLVTLLDVSGTMALPVPGTRLTRMQAISRIAIEGMRLFPLKSEMGLWEFSTHLDGRGVDYRETVPVGPLTENLDGVLRRDLLNRKLAGARAKETGDTGLNDALAAAYERMTEEYQSDKINTVLVLTDGAGNDDPDGGISNREILTRLKEQYDSEKPVSVLIIAFGPDAPRGRRQMEALAKATGGEAYIAKDVLEVRKFFLEGMKRRLCAPNC
ncbi:hypothetical protein FHS43_002410 [Streptosporangium becharense]|uniref:Mg-chelatase subunit ChlD n=1 Tax=Streptosporangium becharense TaxID=1816182 RepID=A0A7W9IJC9_9ACTN|nr:substrate-binding domain-containing protein [Streptosporangium becharense]MBB2911145.1 hypothetical protein [Streptosporangium becharense]MBB5821797.1 Mg-chelatase subunit ChlD [Streptosporangium becharense]